MVSELKKQENFLRNAILTVDHSKEALQCFIQQHLENNHQTFEDFLNQNQHDIYHLYHDSKCCQCSAGPLRRKKQILFASQIELLFDTKRHLSVHKKTRLSDFCCCYAKKSVTTAVLDLTLARCLLMNCCIDIFWYSCLAFKKIPLEQFLNSNKHILYHLWKNNTKCCRCQPDYIFPCDVHVIMESEWKKMFNSTLPQCENDQKIPASGAKSICTFSATPSITVQQIHSELQNIIIQYCCSTRKSVEKLVELRNLTFGHVKEASMSCTEFNKFFREAEYAIIDIATVCGKEDYYRQMLLDLRDKPLDSRMFCQYEKVLLQTINNYEDIIMKENEVLKGGIESLTDSNQEVKEDIQRLCILQREGMQRQRLIDETSAEIDNHRKDQTYTEIKAVTECVQMLDNSKVLILSGREGSGKSRNSLEILRQMKKLHPEIDVIKLKRLTKFTDIIKKDAMTIVLFEDVFGRTRKQFCEDTDIQILDSLHAYISLGNVKVIFVMRNNVKHECHSLLSSHDIFCNNITYLDLNSEEFGLSLKEKERLFINYCTKSDIDIIYRENYSYLGNDTIIIDEMKVFIIDKSDVTRLFSADKKCIVFEDCAVEEMIRSDPYHGFPLSCRLFTQNKKLTMLGAPFFKYPSKSLLQEIDHMRMEGMDNNVMGLKYVILVYIMLNETPSAMTVNAFRVQMTRYKHLKENMMSINEDSIDVQAHQNLFKECYDKTFKVKLHDIICLYEELTCRYLTRKDKKICFQHRAFSDSVLISYSRTNQKAIIPLLSLDHMIDIVRPQNYMEQEDEIVIKLTKPNYHDFAKEIISLIGSEWWYLDKSVLDRFVESKIITDNDGDLIYELIGCLHSEIDASSSKLFNASMFDLLDDFWAYTYHFFPLYLLRNIKNLDDKRLTVNHTKYQMLISGTIGDKHISLGVDPYISLFFAFETKYIDIIKWLLNNTDHSLVDFKNLFCYEGDEGVNLNHVEYIQLIFENVKPEMIDMTQIFMNICLNNYKGEKNAIDWMVDNIDNSLICYDRWIDEICEIKYLNYRIDMILYILKKINHKLMDINNIVHKCCRYGSSAVIVKVLQNVDSELFEKEGLINTMIPNFKDEHSVYNIVKLSFPWITCCDIHRLIKEADNYKWYSVLELLIGHVSDLSIDIVQFIEKMFKSWEEEEEWEYDNKHMEDVFRSLLKHHIDNVGVAKIVMEKACYFGSHSVVEELLLDRFDNISFYFNITLDKCLSRLFNEISVSHYEGYEKLLMLFIQRVNTKFIDLHSVMNDLCNIGHSSAIVWLLENKPFYRFSVKRVMNKACYHGDFKLVDYLFRQYSAENFDFKTAMLKACRNSQEETIDVCKWLWENIDRDLFDMKAALNNASRYDNFSVVVWILTDVDKGLLDIEAAVLCASEHGEQNTVELLLDNSSINMIDFEHAITLACKNENCYSFQIIKRLYELADQSTVDINAVFSVACKNYRIDIIQWIIETCVTNIIVTETSDGNKNFINRLEKHLLDISLVMDCIVDMDPPEVPTEAVDATKNYLLCIILKKSHLRTIDVNKLLTESCKKDWLEIVICLLGKIDHSFLNIREAINVACQCGALNIVKWSLQNIDVKLFAIENVIVESCAYGWLDCLILIQKQCCQYNFNVHQSMVEACTYGRIEIVEWLLQNVNYESVHLPLLLQEAGRNGWINIFSSLVETFKFRTSDLHEAINEALVNGHVHIVEWIVLVLGGDCIDISCIADKIYLDSRNEAVVKFILKHFNPRVLDIATVFTNACKFGWNDTMSFILDNNLSSLCDFTLAFNQACDNGETEIVKLLLEKVDHQILNVNEAMLSVAVKGWDEIAVLLLDKVEHARLDFGNALVEACRHGEIDVVQAILRKVDTTMLDVKTALNKACENHMHEELVLWILENIDHKQVDLESVKTQAIRHKWRKIQSAILEVDTEDLNKGEQETETDFIVIS